MIVAADAGPLIALARVQLLSLLQQLYGEVLIPPAVQQELRLGSDRPGAQRLADALQAGWLRVQALQDVSERAALSQLIDVGEAEAILLAEQVPCRFLLIDERKGRAVAQQRKLPIVGVAGVLLAAKTQALIPAVRPVLADLAALGYRFSSKLVEKVAIMAGE